MSVNKKMMEGNIARKNEKASDEALVVIDPL